MFCRYNLPYTAVTAPTSLIQAFIQYYNNRSVSMMTDEELIERSIIIMNSEEKKQNEKVILMKTLLDLYEQNELFQNIVVQEYIDKLETKLKELL